MKLKRNQCLTLWVCALACLFVNACGSEDAGTASYTPSATNRQLETSKKIKELKQTLPEVEKVYRQVVVVPWTATTSQRYLSFKVHAYDETQHTLTVSTSTPPGNWFSAPQSVLYSKKTFVLDAEKSDDVADVFVKFQKEATSKVIEQGKNSVKTVHTLPFRLEIKLYKHLNGEYTGECDYSIWFQDHGTFWGINSYADKAKGQSCPIHRIQAPVASSSR